MYYYLVKKTGETEWRSHPYLTQNQLLDLPLPDLGNVVNLKIANNIAIKVANVLKQLHEMSDIVDAEVEYMVASIYGLTREDYVRIYQTIGEVQNLVPIKALKKISVSHIFKKYNQVSA